MRTERKMRLLGEPVLQAYAKRGRKPFVLGLCAAQGAGKTTLARQLQQWLSTQGLQVASLSIDDLYLSKADRLRLAAQVHPLLKTRGVPGTHDVDLGLALIAQMRAGKPDICLPRFDKSSDDRCPPEQQTQLQASLDILIFEGWCVGARALDACHLGQPLNALEETEDTQGCWRTYWNAALADRYQALFAQVDYLVFLQAPSWEIVWEWRRQQEMELRSTVSMEGGAGRAVMDDAQLQHFLHHYERLTRWILQDLPDRADMVIQLDADRSWRAIKARAGDNQVAPPG